MGTGTWTPSHHQIYQLFGYGAQTALLTALRSGDAAARKVFYFRFFFSLAFCTKQQRQSKHAHRHGKRVAKKEVIVLKPQLGHKSAHARRRLGTCKRVRKVSLQTCCAEGPACLSAAVASHPTCTQHEGSPKRLHPQQGDPWIDLADLQHAVFLLPRDIQPLGRRKTADYFGRCDIFPVQVGRAARRSQGCWLRESGAISLAVCCVLPAAFHSS